MFRLITRVLGLVLCIYGTNNAEYPPEYKHLVESSLAFRFQYLTIIGLYLTLLTMASLLLHSIFERLLKKELQNFSKFNDFLLVIVLPLEVVITGVFWTLYLYDPSSILHDMLMKKNRISLKKNICMHLIPVLLLILEIIFIKIERQNLHIVIICFISLSYYIFVRIISSREKKWPYPFLDNRSEFGRIAIFFGLTLIAIFTYEMFMFLLRKNKDKKKDE